LVSPEKFLFALGRRGRVIIPIRCFTCGSLIADKWYEFAQRVQQGEDPGKVLDEMGITRYCCRRMFLSHVEVIDKILLFSGVEEAR
jgi:DNA-directed RNA polymerase subunit N